MIIMNNDDNELYMAIELSSYESRKKKKNVNIHWIK